MKLSHWYWHSINVLPSITAFSICEDDHPYETCGRVIELCWFGLIVHIQYETKRFRKVKHIIRLMGPIYSKRRQLWYRIRELDNEYDC